MNGPGYNWIDRTALSINGQKAGKNNPSEVTSLLRNYLHSEASINLDRNFCLTDLLCSARVSKRDLCWKADEWVCLCSTYLGDRSEPAVTGVFAAVRPCEHKPTKLYGVLHSSAFNAEGMGEFTGSGFQFEYTGDRLKPTSFELRSGSAGSGIVIVTDHSNGSARAVHHCAFKREGETLYLSGRDGRQMLRAYLNGSLPNGMTGKLRAIISRRFIGWEASLGWSGDLERFASPESLYILLHTCVGIYRASEEVVPG